MERIAKIGNKNVKLKTSAALPRLYRMIFNRDIFSDMENMQNVFIAITDAGKDGQLPSLEKQNTAITTVENLFFTMAKLADPSISDDIVKWLDGFDEPSVLIDADLIVLLLELWNNETITTAEEKKKKEQSTGE